MLPEITEIISAMEFASERGLRDFVHDDGKTRLVLRREGALPGPALASEGHGLALAQASAAPLAASHAEAGVRPVSSPVPGMCHLSPDPASPPFVAKGGRVEQGQTICVIEAMKVMTAIAAPSGGIVAGIHVSNGSVVAVGDLLMEIRT